MSEKHDATNSLTGYLYQCRLALKEAINAYKIRPSLDICIEQFDDISFHQDHQPVELIQAKHHAKAGNLTDLSVDLWKTIGIWADGVKANPNLPFEVQFSIITTGTAPDNSAASFMRPGNSSRDVTMAGLFNALYARR